jgi:hypothetical protein
MPQSFAIGRDVRESGGNLDQISLNTQLLLQLVDLMQRQNRLLTAINISLGKLGTEFTGM